MLTREHPSTHEREHLGRAHGALLFLVELFAIEAQPSALELHTAMISAAKHIDNTTDRSCIATDGRRPVQLFGPFLR